VHPGAVFPEVDNFQEIGVDAIFGQQAPERRLVELGGAGRHHHPVQSELRNILGDIPLAGLGARVEMIPAHRHSRQTPSPFRQSLRADDPGDVVAAMADVKADSGGIGHSHMKTQVAALIESEGERGKRRKGKKGESNKVNLMGWSLISRKTSMI
jgi:hypothetical protein